MNLRYRPTLDEAAEPTDQVLLEHWTTFFGRQLALRVLAGDADSPDAVVVHVRYGAGQEAVVVQADEQGTSEAASEVGQAPLLVARDTVQHKETEFCSSDEEVKTEHSGANSLDYVSSSTEETSFPEAEELDRTSRAASIGDQARTADLVRNEITVCSPSKGHDQELPILAASEQAADASTGQTESQAHSASSLDEGHQASEPLSASTVNQELDEIKENSEQYATSDLEQDSAPLTGETTGEAFEQIAECLENESDITYQVGANWSAANTSSRPCGDVEDALKCRSSSDSEQGGITASIHRKEHDQEPPFVSDQADNDSLGQTMTFSSSDSEHQGSLSEPLTESIFGQGVDAVKEQVGQSAASGQQRQDAVHLTLKTLEKSVKLVAERHEKETDLANQMEANQSAANIASRPCRGAADSSESRVASDPERDDKTAISSSKEHAQELPAVADRIADASAEQKEKDILSEPKPLSGCVLRRKVDEAKEQSGQSAASCQEQQDYVPSTMKAIEKDVKLVEEHRGKESDVSNQVKANRSAVSVTSPPCGDSSDTEPRCTELRIGRFDAPAVLDDTKLERLLLDMPGLTRLSIDWRLDGRKLDIDIVSRYCPDLVEVDLSRFRLDTWSLEQLCVACPKLEVVKLPRKCDDSCANVLLRKLPKLRSLDLSHTNVTGHFLRTHHDSLEKLSLSGCKNLRFPEVRRHRSSGSVSRIACWEKVRELDLSSTQMKAAELAKMFNHFPRLQRLSLANCDKVESETLRHVTLCKRLRDLDASHMGCVEAHLLFNILTRCPQLERLSVAGCTVRDYYYRREPYQSKTILRLRELNVSEVNGLYTADLTAIVAHSPQLKRLLAAQLDGMDLAACLAHLSRCTELRELDVSRSGTLEGVQSGAANKGYKSPEEELNRRQIQPAVATLLSGCQKLERLSLAGYCISDPTSLHQLGQFPNLHELDVSRVTTLKAAGQAHDPSRAESVDASDLARGLSGCHALERLSVAGLKAPLEQLVPPTGLPNLTYLDASESGLTNNSLRRLPGLFPKLQTLNMHGCSSVRKDGLVSYLPRLQNLRSLNLRGIPVMSNTVLEALKKCQLNTLRLGDYGYFISGNGLVRLALACPSLKFLVLEESDSSAAKSIQDVFRKHLPLDRSLVMRFPKIKWLLQEQTGPLFVLDGDANNWDETNDCSLTK